MGIAAQCVHGAGLCVLPRAENDWRPLALRHGPLAFVSALLVATKVLALIAVAVTPTTAELSTITASRIVQLTNAERTKAGLPALRVSPQLQAAAQQKAAHMLQEDYFAHISPTGVTPWFWIKQAGYTYKIAGENLAIDFSEAEDVVAAWMASPSHKENMLHTSYIETGVAVATGEFQGGTSIVVVHMFGLPSGAAAPSQIKGESTPAPTSSPPAAPATPSPSPVVPVPAPDTTPPRTPRIALVQETSVVGGMVQLVVDGEPGSRVSLLANETVVSEITLTEAAASHTLSLAGIADGSVRLSAQATDAAGNTSATSETLALTKDTVAPELAATTLAFLAAPLTDTATAALLPSQVEATLTLQAPGEQPQAAAAGVLTLPLDAGPITVQAEDAAGNASPVQQVQLAPQFAQTDAADFAKPPARLSQAARRIALSFGAVVALLLVLAVLIQIRVQRPALVAHASAVLGLALLLFLV